ncbi:hypothetical protein [Sphingorhabdus sp. 109]|jgi:hypothetical protein|uniref:hypothetical protein n=1 Tax=Sphingorhabdus sp. 109 TaxID=2653173 RepID=UPI0012F17A64|nr:hypothetical protein [Sphingorhabdus sp. 109]VWX61121.1 conserved exported hypothetical protein [Sphingorhabdus sp. 109]
MKLMKKMMMATALTVAAPLALATPAMADEFPLVAGDYTTMTGIYLEDGGTLAYAKFLAGEWKKNQDFAKSKGWISDYKIYFTIDPREGEPHMYLTQTFPYLPSGAEYEKRNKEWEAFDSRTNAQLDAESGNRAKFRKVTGSMTLQEATIR